MNRSRLLVADCAQLRQARKPYLPFNTALLAIPRCACLALRIRFPLILLEALRTETVRFLLSNHIHLHAHEHRQLFVTNRGDLSGESRILLQL